MPQDANLLDLLKTRIEREGPLPVTDYMEMALTHPQFGYYTRKDPLGTQGDFVTSPEISQIFGELVGAWLAEQWRLMGKPKGVLAELGPGRGTLMKDILRATKTIAGFHQAIDIHLVEASPVLQQTQWQALADKHPRLHWHKEFAEIPVKPLLLVANEFFDALPVRQFIYEENEWRERTIRATGNKLDFTSQPISGTINKQLRERMRRISPVEGMIIEYSAAAEHLAASIGRHIDAQGGVALIIDYGYEDAIGDTLQAVRKHQYHDVLSDPGTADITAHVDFGLLRQAAQTEHAAVYGPAPQGMFLSALGAQMRAAKLCQNAADDQKSAIIAGLERLTSLEQMGDLFKALAITTTDHPKPDGF